MLKDLYLCFVHVPPVNSTYTAKDGDQFENLESEIFSFASLGNITVFSVAILTLEHQSLVTT